jgi:hypothetical protein
MSSLLTCPITMKILTCSITMEILTDPVICSDGFTYERTAIEIWLRSNNTSPMTGLVLENKNLIPNIIVKNLLSEIKEKEKEKYINYNHNYYNNNYDYNNKLNIKNLF